MIPIKIYTVPKSGGSSSLQNGGGIRSQYTQGTTSDRAAWADEAGHATKADEAEHAAKAYDLDANSPANDRFLSKVSDDVAKGVITFEQGLIAVTQAMMKGGVLIGNETASIDAQGRAEMLSAVVRSLLRSSRFRSGFDGEGWQLWQDESGYTALEVDRLTVRQAMTVFELIISRIRAVGGQLVVSAADGKISDVEEQGDNYLLSFEGGNQFVAGDLIRCQVFNNNVRGYWVQVRGVSGDKAVVAKSEFTPYGTKPLKGDECVLMGNVSDKARQALILISATDGKPVLDTLGGVHSKSFEGCLHARLGTLDGIKDSWFPVDNQPHGDGLYSDNAYLRGTFLLVTGEDVKTKFEIVEGRISSEIEGVRDVLNAGNFIDNPSFAEGLRCWEIPTNTGKALTAKSEFVWANGAMLTAGGAGNIWIGWDNGRKALHLNGTLNYTGAYVNVPEFLGDGKKKPITVTLRILCRAETAGNITVTNANSENPDFEDYHPIDAWTSVSPSDDYKVLEFKGVWAATGYIVIVSTATLWIANVSLSADEAGALEYRYKTLFEQTDRLVKISAAVYGEDKGLLRENGIMVTADYANMYAIDKDGNLSGLVGTSAEGVKIQGKKIELKGAASFNDKVIIEEDGTLTAINGNFSGRFTSGDDKANVFNTNGSAYLAHGNVRWDEFGNVVIESTLAAEKGLRYGVQTVGGDATMDDNKPMLVAAGTTKNITINSPKSPVTGEVRIIVNQGLGKAIFTCQDKQSVAGGQNNDKTYTIEVGKAVQFVFAGDVQTGSGIWYPL